MALTEIFKVSLEPNQRIAQQNLIALFRDALEWQKLQDPEAFETPEASTEETTIETQPDQAQDEQVDNNDQVAVNDDDNGSEDQG